ncbi:MAG TPA: amino acid adenylation domain-containing protein [Thermoanaerobaculia bacterium]|nr:amino acid adenylation domain-containing protein [Thermoanaerobaculia bacterium]
MSEESRSERLSRLTPEQRAQLLRAARAKAAVPQAIPRRDAREPLALSAAQLRMWFLERLQTHGAGTAGTYWVYEYLRITGPLDEGALRRAMREVVRRHDALRTSFHSAADGVPFQVVAEQVDFDLELFDAPDEAAAKRILDAEPLRPFDLSRAPLIRATLVRRSAHEHWLLLTLHHIISDGWSLEVMSRELAALYRGETLPELAAQYGDVVAFQSRPEYQARLDAQLDWWKQHLDGVSEVLELPADHPRPPVRSDRGGRVIRIFPKDLQLALDDLAQREQKTLYMVVLAALQAFLHRFTGQTSFAVGTPVANRKLPEAEALIGLFINTVALRADLGDDPTFTQLLDRVRETTLDAFSHEEVPFERVVDSLGLGRDAARTPLFQTMLVFAAGRGETEAYARLHVEPIHPEQTTARFDLTVSFGTGPEGTLLALFDYAADLFEPATVERFATSFEHLLRGAAENPEVPVSRLPLFDAAERERLLHQWNDTFVPRAEGLTLHGLFVEQARRTPDAAALMSPGRTITYRELDAWTDAIAAQIHESHRSHESHESHAPVAILADRSPEAVAAVLGILKAGRPYLPIDPGTPTERLQWLLEDAGAVLMPLVAQNGRSSAPPPTQVPRSTFGMTDVNPAYVIYTSGSTGLPKGVVVEHRSAVNLALSFVESHGFAGHRVLMIPPLPFDASVGDVFPAFASGAALVLHPSPAELNATELARYCNTHRITAIDAPAALWRRWTEEWIARGADDPLPFLTLMMVGGESIPAGEVRRFSQLTRGRVRFFNHYGPTEATVCATTHRVEGEVDGDDRTALPIGKPLPNVTAYVLDRWLEPVPDGVAGELVIGGIGVARGYHNRPEQTAERFITDPFSTTPGARLYRTGDLVRRLKDGSLDFLGRSDRQIKLRGFRIEPGEIEAALVSHPDVRGAVVTLRDNRLVAYVAGSTGNLAAFLRERLPETMIPSAFVALEALPLTSNGKIDYRALPEPPRVSESHLSAPPRDDAERALVEIWREVLGREVGIDDDFFEHGGDSLRTMPLIFRVQQRFGIELPLSSVFTAPTVRRFAPLVTGSGAGTLSLESRIGPPIGITATERASMPPRAAFLTGATGFLGAFLLDELLRETSATIYCLVRANDADDGLRRIRENLATYGLTADLTRVIPILGDLGSPQLGLDDATLAHLAETLDVIYHNGGAVNFIAPYESLEAANVTGTREVLRLAATSRIKPVHIVSTLGVHFTRERIGLTVREADPLPPGSQIIDGYNQTKWVADRVAQLARESGLPVSIHRPARITGESRTGALNPGDFFYSWIKGCVELGAFPDDTTALNMAPVDHIARAIVRLSLSGAAPGDHHYFNNRTLSLETLVASLRSRGFALEVVPFDVWRDALRRTEGNAFAKFIPLMTEPDAGEPFFDCRETEERLAALGVVCPPADEALLETYLEQLGLRAVLPEPVGGAV